MLSHSRLLSLLPLALASINALACSSLAPPPSDEEQFARASAVFVAHLTKTEEVTLSFKGFPQAVPGVEGTFRIVEILKGDPPADGKVQDLVFGPGNCSLALFAGLDYLFFLHGDKWVLSTGGSRGFINLQGAEPRQLLEKLRKLKSSGSN
jgi:hypothetical protein